MRYTLLKQEGAARRGTYETPHGTIQMPAFMNVATAGAIKGGVSALDLKEVHCQVQLCNTYHLHFAFQAMKRSKSSAACTVLHGGTGRF